MFHVSPVNEQIAKSEEKKEQENQITAPPAEKIERGEKEREKEDTSSGEIKAQERENESGKGSVEIKEKDNTSAEVKEENKGGETKDNKSVEVKEENKSGETKAPEKIVETKSKEKKRKEKKKQNKVEKRGRPRKHPMKEEPEKKDGPKRGRGRPRKVIKIEEHEQKRNTLQSGEQEWEEEEDRDGESTETETEEEYEEFYDNTSPLVVERGKVGESGSGKEEEKDMEVPQRAKSFAAIYNPGFLADFVAHASGMTKENREKLINHIFGLMDSNLSGEELFKELEWSRVMKVVFGEGGM